MRKAKPSKWKQNREKRLYPQKNKKIHMLVLLIIALIVPLILVILLTPISLKNVFNQTPQNNKQSFSQIKEVPVNKIDFESLETGN